MRNVVKYTGIFFERKIELTKEIKENKMGVMPENKLLLTMSVPIMISMMVQALYNIVDTVFVSKLGTDALTALSLAFPIQNLMIAVSTGTGVGMNALLSKSLGEKNFDRANKTACNGVFLAICSFLLFLFVGLFLTEPFFKMFGSSESVTEYGSAYLTICCGFSIGLFGQITFERLLQATGKTTLSMISQLTGAIFNIIFDPLLIYGIGIFPEMGVSGAAVATVLGQIIACLAAIFLNHRYNKEIAVSLKGFKPDADIIKRIYSVGLPSIAMGSIGSVMTTGINQIVRICGNVAETAQAVFGLYFKIQSFIFMPVFGLNNGMVPIIAYNYGARKKSRLIKTMKLSVFYACVMMFVGVALFHAFPDMLLNLFSTGEEADMAAIISIGIPALRRISLSFVFAGFCIVTLSVFQALGHGFLSLVTSLLRQLGVLLPSALILALTTKNVNIIWFAFPIAEIAAVTISALFLKKVYQKEIKNLD